MILSIYSVTYASYGVNDGELFTETKIFVDENKARAYQQNNIQCILEDNDMLTDEFYGEHENDNKFEYETDSFVYSTKLEVVDYEFYLQVIH